MKVSICMAAYKRAPLLRITLESIRRQDADDVEIVVCEDGDDGGWTRSVCEKFGAKYFQRKRRPDQPYSNPAIPTNIAIRQATGELLILQNPECRHAADDVIEKLTAPHRSDRRLAVFATVEALQENGSHWQWYCHPLFRRAPYFFCGSVLRENVIEAGGFDEDFGRGTGGYGFDDDFFSLCLAKRGVLFQFRDDIPVKHQWHESTNCFGLESNKVLFDEKVVRLMDNPEWTANAGQLWGSLE